MRLTKSVRVILGIVASGGAALVLSGSAFAANGSAGTTAETGTTKELPQQAEKTGTVVDNSTPAVSVVAKDTNSSDAGASVVTVTTEHKDGAAATGKTPAPDTEHGLKPAAASVGGGPTDSTSGPAKSETVVPLHVDSTDRGHAGPAAATAQEFKATVADPSDQAADVTPAPRSVIFHSTVLPVQPKITTSRPVVAEDLAAMVPSAPAQQQDPAKVPAPSQPTGVLGRLSAELAGSIVPSVFSSPVLDLVNLAATVVMVLSGALLAIRLVVIVFGAWLRRGGYAHAARSDVASATAVFFATPLRLGYVPALQPSHSPFLVVSETKTVLSMVCNALRKEEMR